MATLDSPIATSPRYDPAVDPPVPFSAAPAVPGPILEQHWTATRFQLGLEW